MQVFVAAALLVLRQRYRRKGVNPAQREKLPFQAVEPAATLGTAIADNTKKQVFWERTTS